MPVQHRTQRKTPVQRRRLLLESLEHRCVLAAGLFGVPIGQGDFIVELNPVSGVEIRRIPTPVPVAGGADGLAYNGESLFFLAGGGTLYEINAVSGAVVDSDSLSGIGTGSFDGLGFLNGKLYLQEYSPSQLRIFDPVNDVETGAPFPIAGGIIGGLTGVSNPDELVATQSATTAVRINPTTGAVLGSFSLGGPSYLGVAALNNLLYFGSVTTNHIRVTDRAGALIGNITTPYAFSALASDDTRIERVSNGGFEFGPAGWTVFNQPGSGGSGFQNYTGPTPFSSGLPAPPQGTFAATNQHSGAGTYIMYRDFVLPAGQSHSLSLIAYYQNQFTNFVTPATLDYQAAQNQQFRIDIITLPANLLSVAAGDVLQNVLRTNVGDPLTLAPTTITADLTPFAGQTVRLRIAVVNNLHFLFGAVDAVSLISNTMPTTPPPTTTRIYVGEQDPLDGVGGRVEVFDESLALLSTIDHPVFDTGTLTDVEVGPTGDVFVSLEVNPSTPGRIVRFTSAGAFVDTITIPNDSGGQPLSVLGFDVADDGTFWVAHPSKSNRVFHISAAGVLLGETMVPAQSPHDVTVNAAGQVFASSGSQGEAHVNLRADGNRWQARFDTGDALLLSPTNVILATRTLGGQLIDAQEADSGNLYVTRIGTTAGLNKLTSTGAPAGTVNTAERAFGLAVSTATTTPPTGSTVPRIYVAERDPDSMGGRIEVFDRTLALVQTIDHPIFDTGTPTDIEIGPSGNVFVGLDTTPFGGGTGGRLLEFTPAGTFVGAIDLPDDASGSFYYPLGFAVAADGSFRVAAPNTPNTVFHVSPTGALLGTINVPAVRVIDVAIGAGSAIFATDLDQGDAGISMRADGNLWVGRGFENDLQLRTTAGAVLATRTFGPNNSDLQEAADGNLYVVRFDINGALRRFDAAGNVINTVNLAEVGAGIAIANVPTTFQVSSFAATSTGAVLDFSGDLDPSTLNLYNTQGDGLGPADLVLQGATVGPIRGSVVIEPNLRRMTFIATAGRLPPDTYTLTLRSAADGVRDATQVLLDGDANGTPGGDFVRTFTVATPVPGLVSVGVPNFARGPQQNVNSPANSNSGIPISFSDGGGITSANFQIRYNPSLLTITQAAVAPGMPGNASVNLNLSTPGLAIIQFSSVTPLAAGTTRFVDLLANVPTSAPYRTKHVLDITNVVLNGGTVPAIDDDAIHIAAYFGDATGNGLFSATDAGRISRVAVGFDTGFQLYRLLDPMIMGDISGAGGISSTDASRMLQASVGFPVAEIPPLPLPAVSLTQGGPDPKLSIPTDLVASAGSELIVPVHIDSIVDLTGTGLDSADLVLYYNPAVLEVTRVSLGSLIADRGGWMIASRIDALAGRIFVSLAGSTPLEGFFHGEFVQLHATVNADAPAGSSAINLAASARDIAIYTQLNEGFLTLIPAPTDAADDPGVDGLVTILASPVLEGDASVPAVRVVDERLIITGSDSDERIFVGLWGLDQVRVRVGNRLLGTFDMPAGIAIDGRGGRDVIIASPRLPATVVAADPVVATDVDLVLAGDSTQRQEILRGSDSVHELALLQLVADWSDRWEAASSNSPARPLRWRRF